MPQEIEPIVLPPCPFCGAAGGEIPAGTSLTEDMFCRIKPTYLHKEKFAWACDDSVNCGVCGPFRDTMQEAIDAWGMRPLNAEIVEE